MSVEQLEQTLRNLATLGTLVKDRGYRQVWRFEHGGRGYYVKFYPRTRSRLKRMARGNSALREFTRLQALQKAGIPSARAVAAMVGFRIGEAFGDAVLIEAIEPSIPLDQYLHQRQLAADPVPDRRRIAEQIRKLVQKLGAAKLGHSDLNLGNFLLKDGSVWLIDGHAVRLNGLKMSDVLQLGHSVSRYATLTDLRRGWNLLAPGRAMPRNNPVSRRIWKKFQDRARGGNRYFGKLEIAGWSGVFFQSFKYPHRWAPASRLEISEQEWQREWPALLKQIEANTLPAKKRSRSGDVLMTTVTLGGRTLEVVIKHPRRRYWYRYLNEIGRGSRARRAWFKAWDLVARNIPTAWPLLLMEKRTLGYVTDAVIVFERVPGRDLAIADLDAMTPDGRDMLFRRTGRILRKIDQQGLSHFDAKSSNWIVLEDEKLGPTPILVDIDGIRYRKWLALGIERLLRSMREHGAYTVEDSKALCQGYAPGAKLLAEVSSDINPKSQ